THPCITGDRCKGYDRVERRPAWTSPTHPYCDPCITAAQRDVRMLAWDWVDLAQQQYPTLSQALSANSGPGQAEPPILIREAPDALQREIHHVVTTWETVVRIHARLSTPPELTRHGPAVHRAVKILAPRVRMLAQLGPTAVYPTGFEDDPTDMTGADAVAHLCWLRARSRAMLGWTHRSRWVPGDCWACPGRDADDEDGPLFRSEPRYEVGVFGGPMESRVHCARCGQDRSEADYDLYLLLMRWPDAPEPEPEPDPEQDQSGEEQDDEQDREQDETSAEPAPATP
ncbi:hypothetical protein C1I95_28140, partial [Micromonospora craterilacus]